MIRRSFYLTFCLAPGVAALIHARAEIPGDFALRGRFFPGGGLVDYKDSEPWRLRITANGKAIQETSIIDFHEPPRQVTKSFSLSREKLASLVGIVDQVHFFSLPNHISTNSGEDYAGMWLEVKMRGRTRRVEFVWPTDEKATHNRPALTRFWNVWRAVLKSVPSPNRNSEAVWWLQHVRPDLIGRNPN